MFKASFGGGAATRTVYRHTLARVISDTIGHVPAGRGWSLASTTVACVLMSWDPAPTLAAGWHQDPWRGGTMNRATEISFGISVLHHDDIPESTEIAEPISVARRV